MVTKFSESIQDQSIGQEVVDADSPVKEPPLYNVVMLNDDYTTMEFVILVLTDVFRLSATVAEEKMLQIHHKGKAIVGVFPKDVAESKIYIVHSLAKQAEFPLKCVLEPSK